MSFIYQNLQLKTGLLLSALFICCMFNGNAQEKIFKNYSLEEGLPQSTVLCLYQDVYGNIWEGTQAGLARYNGVDFKIIDTKSGLFGNHITCIKQDNSYNYWIGHRYNGVTVFDGINYSNISLVQSRVNDIETDNHGNVYIGTSEEGLYITHQDSYKEIVDYKHVTISSGLLSNQINDLQFLEMKNEIWIATNEGVSILKLDENNEIKEIIDLTNILNYPGYSILPCPTNDTTWVLTSKGLSKVYKQKNAEYQANYYKIEDDYIISFLNNIVFDSLFHIWGGTASGAFIFDEEKFNYIDLPSNTEVQEILIDFEGSVWFGSSANGLYRYSGDRFTYFDENFGLSNNDVRSIFEDSRNNIWFATADGLNRFDGNQLKSFSKKDGLVTNDLDIVFEDSKGFLWIGSYNHPQIMRYNPRTGTFETFHDYNSTTPQYTITINEDKVGNIWFATLGLGVVRFTYNSDNRTGVFQPFNKKDGICSNAIWMIHKDLHGNLWFGSDNGGMSVFDGESFTTIDKNNGLRSLCIGSITNDSKNNIWLIDIGEGVAKFNGDTFEYFGVENGLSSVTPFSIIADRDDNIWVGSNTGIDFLNPKSNTFTHFGKNDGFIGIETNQNSVCVDHEGAIWFGTVRGVIKMNPYSKILKKVPPKTKIEKIQLFYNDFNYLDYSDSIDQFSRLPIHLELPFDKNHLNFTTSAISYTSPEKVRYKFFLEGFDESWNPITANNNIVYTNLAPGNYTFNVMTSIGDDFSDPALISYSFTILSPVWQKSWFKIVVAVLLLILIWFVLWMRIRSVKRHNKKLRILVDQQTKEIQNEAKEKDKAKQKAESADRLKTTFLANMSHEIRSPLNSIIGFSELLKEKNISKDEQEKYIDYISRSGNNLLILINDIIDVAKIEAGQLRISRKETNINVILTELYVIFHENIEQLDKDVKLELKRSLKEDPFVIETDPVRLKQILTNLLGNAIKFTSKGFIEFGYTIELINRKNYIRFYVKDSGIGIPSNKVDEIFQRFGQVEEVFDKNQGGTGLGLSISKKLTKMLGGEMWVESIYQQGSTFYFTIPYRNILPDEMKNIQVSKINDPMVWKDKQILIVEDDYMSFYFLEALLKSTGIKIIWAKNGKEALEMFKQNVDELDLVVTDINLPYLSGYELLDKIKGIDQEMPVVVQTAYAMVGERKKNIEAGFNDYISKPIDKKAFFEILQRYL